MTRVSLPLASLTKSPPSLQQPPKPACQILTCQRPPRLRRSLAAVLFQTCIAFAADPPTSDPNTSSTNPPALPTPPPVFANTAPLSIPDLAAMQQHLQTAAPRLADSVVAVEINSATGSGVVVSQNGLVLTAAHVADQPGLDVRVTFPNGKTARGKTLGTYHLQDAAMIQITDKGPWPYAELGDLAHARIGDWVLTFGHPGGFERDRPMLARLGRIIRLDDDAVQTDCTVTAGDSGGPLFDMHGKVIAIHSRISDSIAENFHVPITPFHQNWPQLVRGDNWGKLPPPNRAWVGTQSIDGPEGCKIERVETNSPAAKAGLKPGDVVRQLNGEIIRNTADFRRALAQTKPGDEIKLKLRRDNTELDIALEVETRSRRRNR